MSSNCDPARRSRLTDASREQVIRPSPETDGSRTSPDAAACMLDRVLRRLQLFPSTRLRGRVGVRGEFRQKPLENPPDFDDIVIPDADHAMTEGASVRSRERI
jgi:hypothetical protein